MAEKTKPAPQPPIRERVKGRPVIDNLGEYAPRIRALRLAAGLNQPQLASAVGVTKNAVTNWEAGRSRPDLDTLRKLCQALRVSADELLGIPECGRHPAPEEMPLLSRYRYLDGHDRLVVRKLVDALAEVRYSEFARDFKTRFLTRPQSPLRACAGGGVDLSGGGEGDRVLLRACEETRSCDEIVAITGRSMEPMYHNGDRVLVSYTERIAPGEIGIFVVAGEGMIKVYREDGLYPLNPAFPVVRPTEDDNVRCVGRALGALTPEMLPTKDEQLLIDEMQSRRHK